MSNRQLPQRLASIPLAAERLIIVETGMKLYQIFNQVALPGASLAEMQKYGQIMGVVWNGQLTLRPLNSSKVGHAIGMARKTAALRLKELCDKRLLKRRGNNYFLVDRLRDSTEATGLLIKAICDGADRIRKVQKMAGGGRLGPGDRRHK
jgi:hypothetical protein